MKKWWIIPLVILGLVAVGLGTWGYNQTKANRALKIRLANNNRRMFLEAMNRVQNAEVLLAKGIVSDKPEENVVVLTDIWRQADGAQENLVQLPISELNLGRTSNFLNQMGDFCYSLVRKTARGAPVTQEELNQLVKLHRETGVLSDNMNTIFNLAKKGDFDWASLKAATKGKLGRSQPPGLMGSFEKVDKTMQQFPTMAYDGPFSDHMQKRSPKALTGATISSREAGDRAKSFLANRRGVNYVVRSVNKIGGRIPSYRVKLSSAADKNPQVTLDISRKGGHAVWMLNSRRAGAATMGIDEAVDIARDFVKDKVPVEMVATYSIRQQDTVTVTFAAKQDNYILYPDQVKIKVAMDNGEIVGYEAVSYLMVHTKRKLPEPKFSEAKAQKAVSERIDVTGSRLTLIPLESGQEIPCWEFRGKVATEEFLVYINVLNGREERILKLIQSPQGELAQ